MVSVIVTNCPLANSGYLRTHDDRGDGFRLFRVTSAATASEVEGGRNYYAFLRVFLGEMFFRLRFIIGKLREWTTRSSVAGGLDMALLTEEKLRFSAKLNRLFTNNGY